MSSTLPEVTVTFFWFGQFNIVILQWSRFFMGIKCIDIYKNIYECAYTFFLSHEDIFILVHESQVFLKAHQRSCQIRTTELQILPSCCSVAIVRQTDFLSQSEVFPRLLKAL